ncbi:MAG: hypothetical protein NT118_02220 [Lentisphaerae bacterium]|nr:hypothetical protein [Lentisphaerota bacterium]
MNESPEVPPKKQCDTLCRCKMYVVYYGAKILGDDSIHTEYSLWLDKADEEDCEKRFYMQKKLQS